MEKGVGVSKGFPVPKKGPNKIDFQCIDAISYPYLSYL